VQHRVFVTGMGAVTCLGSGIQDNWTALMEGRSGIVPITHFDARDFISRIGGEIQGDFDPDGLVPRKDLRRMDKFQQFAMVAAAEAVRDSGITFPPKDNPYKYGALIGSGMGGLATIENAIFRFVEKGPRAAHPLTIPKAVTNLAPGLLSIKYGLKGPNFGIVNACTSGTSAIGEACRLIREGRAVAMIAGGSEAVLTNLSVSSFNALRALSTRNDEPEKASRPFDLDRDGFVLSEGAGIMILESEEHAKARGARVYAEIVGYGATDDAYHVVMPDPDGEGAYWAMKFALEDAGVNPEQIDYINAHGTSTELNDKI
jgi:3-oxoacyl-[acyl-carrier-protein] synthase II